MARKGGNTKFEIETAPRSAPWGSRFFATMTDIFEFKPFDEMTPEDYAAIGLRSGLEIHQQLLTEKKIFCRCPAGRYSKEYDSEILRHMRPTLSELGEYDGTALMEFKTKKEIIYRINRNSVCTYEMDDTPPFMLNDQALDIALEVAMMLDLNLVDELHIARKQYLDGSIPTGFQRTTIVGVDGWIPYKGRKIGIFQLGLEEDACREVSDIGHERVYLTDRLGMPLIEPVTHPDMQTPQEVAEVGDILSRLMRSTGKVRTGHGATRQDVNVSVEGSTRIEIKGVPSLRRVPLLVYNEAMRQWNLLRIRALLAERGITPATFSAEAYDATALLARTAYGPIRRALAEGAVVRCVKLNGFAGVLDEKTQTDTVFAKEISDRVRVVACLTRLPNIIYSDAAEKTLAARAWKGVRELAGAGPEDELVVAWGHVEDAECAAREIELRAREATEGVPSETRQALRDGTTGFERILPGPERMYPDTDLPPLALERARVESIRKGVPEPVWEREQRLESMGLAPDAVEKLAISPRYRLFDHVVNEMDVDPKLAGDVIARRFGGLVRNGVDPDRLTDDEVAEVLGAYQNGRVSREGIVPVLARLASTVDDEVDAPTRTNAALSALGFVPLTRDELEREVTKTVEQFDVSTMRRPEATHHHLMGILMARLTGRAEGARVAKHLEAALKSVSGV
jgi:glutamyl-tRNA(Gln) amidotransferase subunit E